MLELIKNFFTGAEDSQSDRSPDSRNQQTSSPFDLEAFRMNDVKVFALSTCIHCRNAKKYLDECGVKYECVHVDELTGDERKQAVDEIKKHNPAVSFPTIVIKDKVVVGYHKDKIDAALKGE
ncbi:hypothetical protein JCM14722_00920 [Pseudodesulfovibrio portus]|uniref:Glutaredoxin domain-containing protein n=2 Tax=Pseudodesulfovibrio portus TaxID=231439 RepID=A0ABN6RNZ0_9BACT|nr:hypothetical protein JCM14722_00920 [Pseudodesulfovibrio portus]